MIEVVWGFLGGLVGLVFGLCWARKANDEDRMYWLEEGKKAYLAQVELEKEKEGLRRMVQENLAE